MYMYTLNAFTVNTDFKYLYKQVHFFNIICFIIG